MCWIDTNQTSKVIKGFVNWSGWTTMTPELFNKMHKIEIQRKNSH